MGAGVSSERKVELVVEQIAWELRRIRDQGGKVVVVAGPVVIHTGGGEHLARLIREHYVHVLLGGNAIAVHDMEQNMLGTSLGMDMKRGVVRARRAPAPSESHQHRARPRRHRADRGGGRPAERRHVRVRAPTACRSRCPVPSATTARCPIRSWT